MFCMISRKIKEVLKIVCTKLKGKGIDWVLVGSTNLALQRINVTPHDIDILTDKKGAYSINELLRDYEIKKVEYRESENLASYFGEFRIEGVKVEVMGDLRIKHPDGTWYVKLVTRSARNAKIGEMEIPLQPLEKELEGYKILGRVEKVREIEKAIRKRRVA